MTIFKLIKEVNIHLSNIDIFYYSGRLIPSGDCVLVAAIKDDKYYMTYMGNRIFILKPNQLLQLPYKSSAITDYNKDAYIIKAIEVEFVDEIVRTDTINTISFIQDDKSKINTERIILETSRAHNEVTRLSDILKEYEYKYGGEIEHQASAAESAIIAQRATLAKLKTMYTKTFHVFTPQTFNGFLKIKLQPVNKIRKVKIKT